MDVTALIEIDDTFRLGLIDASIAFLLQQDDARAPEAIAHYQAQREELVRRIQASNPPPVVIEANVATLGARGGNHGAR